LPAVAGYAKIAVVVQVGMELDTFGRAAGRFRSFFRELNETFLEREDVLAQTALALLSREHLLLTGPPGTAKSQLARSVLGRIVDATTGQPSLFARQFTENTVLTDLVGAIDFKTLMDTGRTEHFTDEGIIGSVHAFLDEVFDGRDMLLRSTLNLLGERELKQGVRTTKGRVECSLMTSNRYLSEVLDESREPLLAFVDRIAFVGFVPKGFSSPEPMRRVIQQNVSGHSRQLRAYLSIQDVDVLQSAVDRVRFPEAATARLVAFLDSFESEVQAAVRAIADFTPSRYLSVRTRVRAAKVLKAIVVYRRVVDDAERPLEVQPSDFQDLRFVLTQSGPPRALLERFALEQDPREARQLKLIQIERDIFERVFKRVDQSSWREESQLAAAPDWAALESKPVGELVEVLVQHSRLPAADEHRLSLLIMRRAIEQGLEAGGADDSARAAHAELVHTVEAWRGPRDQLALWLQARGLSLLEAAVHKHALSIETLAERRFPPAQLIEALQAALQRLRALQSEADELAARRPDLPRLRLEAGFVAVTAAVTNRLREQLHRELDGGARPVADVGAARGAFQALDGFIAVARQTHPAFEQQLAGLSKTLLEPLALQRLGALAAVGRDEYLTELEAAYTELVELHLARHLPLHSLLTVVLEHVTAQDATSSGKVGLPMAGECSKETYQALRRALPRSSLALLLVQICLRVDGAAAVEFATGAELGTFRRRLTQVPEPLRSAAAASDCRTVSLLIGFFEQWQQQPDSAYRLLEAVQDYDVLSRLRLETELVEALFESAGEECARLRARLDSLQRALQPAE
jgi:MoxR-like ATPase